MAKTRSWIMTVARARGVGVGRCFLGTLARRAFDAAAAEPAFGGAGSAQTGATKSFGSRERMLEVVMRCARWGRSGTNTRLAGRWEGNTGELTFEDLDDYFEETRGFSLLRETASLSAASFFPPPALVHTFPNLPRLASAIQSPLTLPLEEKQSC